MDDFRIALGPRNTTPSLCSNVTLWESDNVEASEPLAPPDTFDMNEPERSDGWSPVNSPPSERLSSLSSLPHRLIRPVVNVATQPHTEISGPGWIFYPLGTPAERSQLGGPERRQIGAQDLADVSSRSIHQPRQDRYLQTDHSLHLQQSLMPAQAPPSEMSFMDCHPNGDATVSFLRDSGEADSIGGLHLEAIARRCPLLAAAFESRSSGPRLHLETLAENTAIPFLRYLYTGSYALIRQSDGLYGDLPTSLLLHSQMYHLGAIYDLTALMEQAYVNIIRQCEFGCSSPDPPIHLSEAIKYVYKHLGSYKSILDTIVSYCVACFLRHRLAEDEEFKQFAFELKPFHQALCRESMDRGFENETASAIIQMPFKRDAPETYLSREDIVPSRVCNHYNRDAYNNARMFRQNAQKARLSTLDNSRIENPHVKQAISRGQLVLTSSFPDNQGNQCAKEEAKKIMAKQEASAEPQDPMLVSTRSTLLNRLSPQRDDNALGGELSREQSHLQASVPSDDSAERMELTELSSDSDYEMITGPSPVETLSEGSDLDDHATHSNQSTSAVTEMNPLDRMVAGSLRNLRLQNSSDRASESSDSEWSLI